MIKVQRWTVPGALILLAVGLTLVSAQEPDITERILPEIKRMGETGRLKCVVTNQQSYRVYWTHKESEMIMSMDDKIIIDEAINPVVNGRPKYQIERTADGDKLIYTIIINRLGLNDVGNYTCQILVRGNTKPPSKDGEMIVMIPPAIVRAKTTHKLSVMEGDTANLTCSATGYPAPNITWFRVNGNVLPGGKLKHKGSLFTIKPVTKRASGVYRCLADNNVRPPAYSDVMLVVAFKPEARAVQPRYGQAQNRLFDATLVCRVAGWPQPDLKWYKVTRGRKRDQIIDDDKHTISIPLNHASVLESSERWLELVIINVQGNDYGEYICEGRNHLGTGTASIVLFETSECQGPICPSEDSNE